MDNPNKKWTTSDFFNWCEENASEIQSAETKNQLAVDDLVFRDVARSMKGGMTFEDAKNWALSANRGWNNCAGVYITKNAIKKSLGKIDLKSKVKNEKGG